MEKEIKEGISVLSSLPPFHLLFLSDEKEAGEEGDIEEIEEEENQPGNCD